MLIEKITKERLECFYKNCKYLENLKKDLEGFKSNYNFLKASGDFSNTRVTSGNKKWSEEEQYVNMIQRKSKEYEILKRRLENEKFIIETQIKRLTNPTYQKILTRRYLMLEDWRNITFELYGGKDDWTVWGHTKYELLTMNLHRRARDKLLEISQTPFLPETEQKTIKDLIND